MKPGTKVLAVRNVTKEKVYCYGVVEYVKTAPPEEPLLVAGMPWKIDTPWFKTESGELLYGCECWYAPPNQLAELVGEREVEHVTPASVRKVIEERNAAQKKAEATEPRRLASVGGRGSKENAQPTKKEQEAKTDV